MLIADILEIKRLPFEACMKFLKQDKHVLVVFGDESVTRVKLLIGTQL